MYYTASSVITVLTNHPKLSVDNTNPVFPFPVPSCPEPNDAGGYCQKYFPKCRGEKTGCSQKLRLLNQRGNPVVIELSYFIDVQSREGRIKKDNATLRLIRLRYGLDEKALADVKTVVKVTG